MENYSMFRFDKQSQRDRITFNSVMAKCWQTDIVSTNSKWHISLRKLARPKNSGLKSFRIEVEGIRPRDIRQLLQYWDWNLNVVSFGNLNVVELNIFQALSYNNQ
ncbi:PREDICTED: PRUPE_1G559500 [Prunus dulcis]|uniref:PREDICTED: PRUPE_1G559500 n=1 Tax=Prunus dulcis TaxID=3755 RepID=A0A5E4EVQ1_PRUDU|nr:PREDICTED: PRUPE_1G559500 [Prunus dulcis]